MGASSSGLLDEAKIANIKGLVINMFQSFSVFYHEQHAAAFLEHLHQEVEPRKEGRGLLLAQRPQDPSDTVLYQGGLHLSGCDEQVKKWKERYAVLRKDHNIEIHENQEAFSRGCAAKLVLQTAGGVVFSTEEESRAHLEQTCAGVLNDVKDDSSSVVSPRDVFGAYLHLPYVAPTCFLFKQEEERDHFLSALKTCIRHSNLEPWCDPTYESQAFIRALQLYRQEKGCYESWEMLLGTEEKVLSCQLMEEVLPCLQRELHSKVKGKKMERIRQWTATMQATYTLVLEQVSSSLQALRDECCQKASSSQTLIRSDLDQIVSSLRFLEGKVRACVCEEAEGVCAECVAPYISSVLEALAEKISAGFSEMQQTLRTQMDAVFAHKSGGTEETKKALSGLRSTSLERCYRHVEKLTEKLEGLKQRFGLKSIQRLVHSAQLDMEKLLDNAVYTLELFLQPSAKLQPLCAPVKMAKAKERVLKQLDYDSRVLQRRLYQQALLEITLPTLFMKMGSKWKTELRTLEQYIFSDYSSFILIRNVHNEVLRNILSNVIETVLQDAACKKINNVLVDTSDLAISQYSLLGQTPPPSAPDSPDTRSRDSCPAVEDQTESEEAVEQPHVHDAKQEASASENPQQDPASLSPLIVVTQELNGSASKEENTSEETTEEVHPDTDVPSTTAESDARQEDIDPPADREGPGPSPAPPHITAECFQGEEPQEPPSPDLFGSEHLTEKQTSDQHLSADSPVNIRLGLLSQAIAAPPGFPAELRSPTDRAVYLSGEMKDNWEVERVEEEEETRRAEVQGTSEEEAKETGGGEEKTGESAEGEETPESPSEPVDKISQDSEPPEGSGATSASRRHAGEEEEQKKEEEEQEEEEEQKKEEEEQKEEEEEEQKEGEEEQKEEEEEEQKEEEERKEEEEEKEEKQEEQKEEEKEEEEKEEAKKEKEEEQQKEEEEKQEEQKEEEKEEAKKEKEEEQQKEEEEEQEVDRGRGGGEREEVLHDGPPLEPGPDSIAAIRELVSEVIEVEVNIGPDPDLPQGHPAPPTNVSL